jgi:ligand-binding sensor domain-containing protein
MRTSDQFDMFNGAPDRYEWKLVGKKEMYVPYNSYKLHSDSLKYDDILKPLHINQDLTRYELHRVWVVDATLKPGTSHVYSRRTFYIDEDSWQILAADQYDGRGQLWRVSEAHCINYYDALTFWSTLEVHTDLVAGRYLAIGLDNQNKMYQFGLKRTPADYTPARLRMEGVR